MTRQLREYLRAERSKIMKRRYLFDVRQAATKALREQTER
jgi:hypothetical protein